MSSPTLREREPRETPARDRSTDALFWSGLAAGLSMGFYAGWIIALLVWVLPGAEYDKVVVIVVMTWLIAAGGFAHVVAGSSEIFYAAWRGEASWAGALAGFVLPSLIGNMLGGLTLATALNRAQATAGE